LYPDFILSFNCNQELVQKKKKALGPHKFLRKKEGAVASSQGAAVYHDMVMDRQAIDDMTHFSIKHAKQEGYVQPHHEVFAHHEFLEVGEGKSYEVIQEEEERVVVSRAGDNNNHHRNHPTQPQMHQQQQQQPTSKTMVAPLTSSTTSSLSAEGTRGVDLNTTQEAPTRVSSPELINDDVDNDDEEVMEVVSKNTVPIIEFVD
jgi:hypothetical protein